ncbi:acyl carrier protein [Candidatus Woesearchaeota archaeon]|nr:acyl carrier protein [Candidatus Woesearchaeota archaeon]
MENLKEIVSRVLEVKDVENISREKTEEWDSFNHLMLVSEIEKNLGIKFTIEEVEKIKNYENLKNIVSKK